MILCEQEKTEVLPNYENSGDEARWAALGLSPADGESPALPVCLHLVSGDCGGTGFSFCRGLGEDKV